MNILEKIKLYINKENLKSEIAKVLDVDRDNNLCTILILSNNTQYTTCRLSPILNANNVVYPLIGSFVVVSFISKHIPIIISISNPSTYKVETIDDDNKITNLRETLDKFITALQDYNDNILNAITNSTYATPSGPTSLSPLNILEFQNISSNFKQQIDEYSNNIKKLYI